LIIIISFVFYNYKLLLLTVFVLLPVCALLLYFRRKKLKVMSEKIMSDNGTKLSVGQKQRLAIARALYRLF
jgi:ABC-type lipoprotein export system ATPase subunit